MEDRRLEGRREKPKWPARLSYITVLLNSTQSYKSRAKSGGNLHVPGNASTEFDAQGAVAQSSAYVILLATIAAISGFLFGFDTAVINGVLFFLRKQFALSNLETEVAASSLLLGCLISYITRRLKGCKPSQPANPYRTGVCGQSVKSVG